VELAGAAVIESIGSQHSQSVNEWLALRQRIVSVDQLEHLNPPDSVHSELTRSIITCLFHRFNGDMDPIDVLRSVKTLGRIRITCMLINLRSPCDTNYWTDLCWMAARTDSPQQLRDIADSLSREPVDELTEPLRDVVWTYVCSKLA
jgi:hypothetical protein